jgi:nucleoside-diphosphate-sugar epimerase
MIFVTGGTGLVGSHLLVRLSNLGREITALKRSSSDLHSVKKIFKLYASHPEEQFSAIQWVEGDLNDVIFLEETLNGIDEVYHCAAIVSFHPSFKRDLFLVNIQGTANLVNAALKANVKKFCHVSSVGALGSADPPAMIDEQTIWKNTGRNSVYGISKYGAEREVWRGIAEGLNATIVNPSVILGPGNWESGSSELFSLVWRGLKFYTRGTKGFVDVRDVAESMVLLMDNNRFGERFLISSENLNFRQLFGYIAGSIQRNPPTIEAKPWIGAIAWRLMTLKGLLTGTKPAITRETVRTANSQSLYSSAKIIRELGFTFIPVEKSIQEIGQLFMKDHISA